MAAPLGQPLPVQYPDAKATWVAGPVKGRVAVLDVTTGGTSISMRSLGLLGKFFRIKHCSTTAADVLGYFLRLQIGGAALDTTAPLLAARVNSNPTQQCGRLFSLESEQEFCPDPGMNGEMGQPNDMDLVFVASSGTIVVEIYDATV